MHLRLNLGCNDDHRAAWTNVDIAPPADVVADLNQPWPWPDNSVSHILANDVLEHLDSKIWAMNEAHRVLEPGGVFELAVPCVMLADGRVNPGAFADPTHRTFWTVDDIYYFGVEWDNPQGERGRLGPAYGITALFAVGLWEARDYGQGRERRAKIHGVLRAVKAAKPPAQTISPSGIESGEAFGRV